MSDMVVRTSQSTDLRQRTSVSCSCDGRPTPWEQHKRWGSSWQHRPCYSATWTRNTSPSWNQTRSYTVQCELLL